MLVLVTGIYTKLFKHGPTQPIVGEHALYRAVNGLIRFFLHQFLKADCLKAASVTGMTIVHLLLGFISGYNHFVSIDYYNVVPGVYVWGKGGLVLAAKD